VKCDLCEGEPYCVKYCETGALRYIEAEDAGIQRLTHWLRSLPPLSEKGIGKGRRKGIWQDMPEKY